MKRTQVLDSRRNIRKEIVAFISIVVIGMLAAVAYLSVAYSAVTLRKDALHFFNSRELWDYEITSTLLMDEEDLSAIRAIPGVQEAERVWQIDTSLRVEGDSVKVTVVSLPQRISLPVLLEGRMPETAGECAVEMELLTSCTLSLGQRISLEEAEFAGIDPLAEKELVITGVFQTPDHITHMVPATPYILVTEDGFDREALDGAFMKARVRVENAPEDRYSDGYWQTLEPVGAALEAMGEERGPARLEKLRSEYEAKLQDGQAQLDEAAQQLEEGRERIESGYRDLERALEQLGLGKDLLDLGELQLKGAKGLLLEGAGKLNEYREALASVRAILDKGEDWLAENTENLNLPEEIGVTREEFLQAVENGEEWVMDWLAEKSGFNEGERQYAAASEAYYAARNEWYYQGEEYLDALTRLEKGRKQLEKGEQELAEGQAAYEDAAEELDKAREALDQLNECRWVTLNNRGNAGYLYARENAAKLSSLSMSFSSIFLVVGALVIYATIGRMVEQHRKLIGATKAMGLYNREVFAKYLFFACGAVMLGVGLGILLAWLPIQRALLQTYEKLFTYGTGTRSFLPLDTALVVVGAFAISLVSVYLGCTRLLRLPAIKLMQEAIPASGRKKARRSAQKSLYSRLIFRNMRTDWNRVLVTTVSVASGCMLMVIGFTLRYGISAVPGRQFGLITTYEADVFYDAGENPDAAAEIEAVLDQYALPHARVLKQSSLFDSEGTLNALTMIVSEKGGLEGFYRLNSVSDGEKAELPESGALVPRRFWEHYGLGVGDAVPVYGTDLKLRELAITDVFENYYGQLFFLTPQSYREAFLTEAEDNCILVRTGEMSLEELQEKLAGVAGLVNVNDATAEREVIEQLSSSLTFVVWFMLFIAGMMACFIVANFSVTYIQRKTRELTVMRINGFSSGECIRYTAVDLIVTTLLGTLLGLVLGGFAGFRILMVTETPYIQMAREPFWQTYVYSALITCGFSLLTNSYALQRVKKLKLSDMN